MKGRSNLCLFTNYYMYNEYNYVIFNQLHVLTLLFSTGEGLDCVMGENVSASIHTNEKLSFWNAYWPGKRILGKRPLLII